MTDIELSQQEYQKLQSAMKKPQFVQLMNQYVQQISDPKNKAQYEQYLKQLQTAGDLPPGRVLLRPDPAYCIKTILTNKRTQMKLFINLCTSDRLPAPKLDRQGKGGNWSLPYAMGQPRHDKDIKGIPCLTMDCAFHPQSFQIAAGSMKFMQLICDTSIDAAGQVLQKQGDKPSKDYKMMKNLRCKGGSPGSIMVSEARLVDPSLPQQKKSQQKKFKLSEEGPSLYKELVSTQRKAEEQKLIDQTKEDLEEEEEEKEVQERPKGIVKPKFKLLHSADVDLADFLETRARNNPRPKSLILVIEVPWMEKLSDVKLDVNENLVTFEVKDLYYLEVKLSYPVVVDDTTAKFDRGKKQMRVEFPVVQLPLVQPDYITPQGKELNTESSEQEVEEQNKELEEDTVVQESQEIQQENQGELEEQEQKEPLIEEIQVEQESVEIEKEERSEEEKLGKEQENEQGEG